MELGIREKRAFVSGATRGIGLAVARALAAEGVALHLVNSTEERLRAVADDLSRDCGVTCTWSVADCRTPGCGRPRRQEVASAVLSLVSQESAYIAGSTITVTGGMTHGV